VPVPTVVTCRIASSPPPSAGNRPPSPADDHEQLDRQIVALLEPSATVGERDDMLDVARVSFAAHADAEASVLHGALAQVTVKHDLVELVAQVLAEHRVQEAILRRMDARMGGEEWVLATVRLRRSLTTHGARETATIQSSFRDSLPALEYQRLGQRYVTERLRALDMFAVVRPLNPRCAQRAPRRAAR